MSRWAKAVSTTVSTFGKDGYHLVRALASGVRSRGTLASSSAVVRPILLDHARQANRVATSILKVDKEFGLMKYWGLAGYVKQRLSFASSTAPASENGDDASTNKGGRIAFMITAAMKTELSDRLGYDPEDVKKMTPVQASLLLNNSVPAQEMEARLPILEEEYQAELEREQQQKEEEEKLRQSQHQELELSQQQQPQEIDIMSPMVSDSTIYDKHRDIHVMSTTARDGYASANVLLSELSWGAGKTWFEVTETESDGESSRVGLYTDQDEAQLGLEARRYIADREDSPLTYELREVAAETLYKNWSSS